MEAAVRAASIQDRDGGVMLVGSLFGMYPFLLKLYADAGYQGPKFQQGLALVCRTINVEIVRRCDTGQFVVLPKRWIVERTIAWLNRCRRRQLCDIPQRLVRIVGDGPLRVEQTPDPLRLR